MATAALGTTGQDRERPPELRASRQRGHSTLSPDLSHSNCRARALCSHFLSPTQELGNLDSQIAAGILNNLISHR